MSSDSEYGFNTVGQFSLHTTINIARGSNAFYSYDFTTAAEGVVGPNIQGEKFWRIQIERAVDPIHTCAGHRLYGVEFFQCRCNN